MSNKSKRTHPLDRDGDGEPGGSLPGNQTATMVDEAATTETPWSRDNAAILLKLAEAGIEIDPTKPVALTEDALSVWSDADAQAAEVFADQMNAEGSFMCDGGEWLTADRQPIDVPQIVERYLFRNVEDDDDTFDAEQVEAAATPADALWPTEMLDEWKAEADRLKAGEGAVMAEEGETVAEPAAATAPADLIAVDDGERQVAVRVRELRILLGARRLYKSADGYSASFGAPFIDQATVDAWLAAGLADAVPSAGNQGGVRATAKARQALADAQTPQVAE